MGATGVVLAGGESRRMGSEKAELLFGGRRVVDIVIESLGEVCDEVIVAGKLHQARDLRDRGARWVADAPGTTGPLAGLAAALEISKHDRCLLVACDMPFLNGDFLRYLANEHTDCDALVPAPDGRPQPLHAAYSRACLATARSLLQLGPASMRDLLSRRRVRYVRHDQCLKLDQRGLSWFNMNGPDDYNTAQYYWSRHAPQTAIA